MTRAKKVKRGTSFVTLRTKNVSKGRKSFYLDIYKDGERVYEFLHLYLVPVIDEATKIQNFNTEQAAIAIRNQRELEIIQGKGGLRTSKSNIPLLDWMNHFKELKLKTGQSNERALSVEKVMLHLKAYAGDKVTLGSVDERFCKGFIMYLANANSGKHTVNPRALSKSTANSYFQLFISALNQAVREKIILSNPTSYLTRDDKKPIKSMNSNRSYLSIDEVKALIETDYDKDDDLKCAFLFSCFTGLRIGDIQNLRWSDIEQRDNVLYLSITMGKTKERLTIKLNKQAVNWLPEKRNDDEVFILPFYGSLINERLKAWCKKAGISKNVCFHMARHTFATMELTLGVDLYVVSKLLGHKDVSVTQIYADIINKKRDEAIDKIDEAF